MRAAWNINQWREITAVSADENRIVVNRVLVAIDAPIDGAAGLRGDQVNAVVDASLDGRAFFVVVPGCDLQGGQLFAAGIEFSDFTETLQPGLSAVLVNYAIRAPCGQGIVEAFEGSAHCQALRRLLRCLEERVLKVQFRVEGIVQVDIHPRIAAVRQSASKTVGSSREQKRVSGDR